MPATAGTNGRTAPTKRAMTMPLAAVAAEQAFAAIEQLRIARERPHAAQARAEAAADPEAQRVAGEGAAGRGRERVRAGDVAEPDHHPDREQQRQRRHHDAHHRERVAERDQEHQPARRERVCADPGDEGIDVHGLHRPIIAAANHARASPTLRACTGPAKSNSRR